MSAVNLKSIDWSGLTAAERRTVLQRPAHRDSTALLARVRVIIDTVRREGDAGLKAYARELDGVELETLAVSRSEFEAAEKSLTAEQRRALERAIANVTRFHEAQQAEPLSLETSPGVRCERHYRPIDAVGLYVPAGTAPLPSAAIMLAVPARIAGCPVRVMCTPPQRDGKADPAVLVAARLCGVDQVFKSGGAQAIAAMAYGTASIPKVDKIYGPGSAWVTAAKLLVGNDPDGAALDLPAGPSEVLVVADDTANPEFVAADLLAQAEHSADAQVVLVTTAIALGEAAIAALDRQMTRLSRGGTLKQAIEHARIIVVTSLEQAFEVSNAYAPEHLIVQTRDPRRWLPSIRNAGSVFLGAWTPETMGDYCSGTNHVLPTYGFARAYSGLSLVDFLKRITVQELTAAGLQDLGPTAVTIAGLEGLDAHANAVTVRLDYLAQSDGGLP